jgi:hypothetical protein
LEKTISEYKITKLRSKWIVKSKAAGKHTELSLVKEYQVQKVARLYRRTNLLAEMKMI